MVKLNEPDIHSDHVHWRDDFSAWIQDVNRWQGRHDAALAELRQLYATIVALKSAVHGHAESITMYSDICDRHDKEMAADPKRGGDGTMTFVHHQVAAKHAHLKGDHKRIQKHHGSVLSRISKLLESRSAADMKGEAWTSSE